MTQPRPSRPFASFPWRSAITAALVVGLLVGLPAFTDDEQLLRFDIAKPYVFILLDTSASMGLEFSSDGEFWTPGGADGPGSRLYQAKQALYNTFENVNDVHFGFASYNQDRVRAYQKHWLYYHDEGKPDRWPIAFPLAETVDADGDGSVLTRLKSVTITGADGSETETDEDTRVMEDAADNAGHLLTFGNAMRNEIGAEMRVAGECRAPLDVDDATDQDRLQTFPIDGQSGGGTESTRLWIEQDGQKYLLEVKVPGEDEDANENRKIGQDHLFVQMDLHVIDDCDASLPSGAGDHQWNLTLRQDPHLSQTFFIDGTFSDGTNDNEFTAGLWEHQDVVSEAEFERHPFTGEGWESNYDSGGVEPTIEEDLEALERDKWCASTADGSLPAGSDCGEDDLSAVRPTVGTVFDPYGRRALDLGDVIPFHWTSDQQANFLDRLAPAKTEAGDPDFRTATYFDDQPAGSGPLQLSTASNRPLLALDLSPLQRAINDVRCWYLGNRENGPRGGGGGNRGGGGNQKCKNDNPFITEGWEELACENDGSFGCRRPYMIIISDGEANTGGENPVADVADLQQHAGIRTWVLNVGDADNCSSGSVLHSISRASSTGPGKDNCINTTGGDSLRNELESILGLIRTEVRAFASAAVPTVQATVEDKVYLTNFTPFNDSGIWDGHVQAFIKSVPVIEGTTRPDSGKGCSSDRPGSCFLWDAGENLLEYQYPPGRELEEGEEVDDLLDDDKRGSRRVYYALAASEPGTWGKKRRLFTQPPADRGSWDESQEVRFDLWDALGISYSPSEASVDSLGDDDPLPNQTHHTSAQQTLDFVLGQKSGSVTGFDGEVTDTLDFLLGDVFHSTPQVVGTPPNLPYLAKDLYGDAGGECTATEYENKGYRCFWMRHRYRRKMLLVGANDGQLHVFEAGRFRGYEDTQQPDDFFTELPLATDAYPDGRFDNGTGLEMFSYIPRQVLPLLHEQEEDPTDHVFSVDGDIVVADVFIDPIAESAADFPDEEDREWRTLVIGSLREGGAGYYALDITQPDELTDHPELGIVPEIADGYTNDPATAAFVPSCNGTSMTDNGTPAAAEAKPTCGTLPFPSVAWEFTDSLFDVGVWWQVDEDEDWFEDPDSPLEDLPEDILDYLNGEDDSPPPASIGQHDLGDTWSTPNIGRIRICEVAACSEDDEENGPVDRFVAIFGGGMDVQSKFSPNDPVRGNWLYMVDVETGQVIYKQRLEGAAPADPAAVDTTGDGYIDRIYIGTLAGYLYRVDLGPVDGFYPQLEPMQVTGRRGSESRKIDVMRVPRDVWVPAKIFDTNIDVGVDEDGSVITDDDGNVIDQDTTGSRPIYYPVTVIYQSGDSSYVLAFGTGDREDLWSLEDVTGRFYMLVDPFGSTDDVEEPLNEADLARVETDGAPATASSYLDTGGWYLVLAPKERVITDAFALSGITVFSAYVPLIDDGIDDEGEDRDCGDPDEVDDDTTCSLRGTSNVYVVRTTNANGLLFEGTGESRTATRVVGVSDFVTNPFTEPGQSNESDSDADLPTADVLSESAVEVMESLKDLFPEECKFANYRIDIKTISSDTQIQHIASVPVCIIEHNWREF